MFKRRVMVITALVFCLCFMSSLIAMAQQEEVAANAEQRVENALKTTQEESVPAATPSIEPVAEPAAQPAVEPVAQPAAQEAPKEEAVAKTGEATTQWLWGEIVSVDQEKKELVVKHMNYETYEDIDTTVKSDENTMFENVVNLSEIKAGDRVTLDYKVKDGSNMAELIVVEKEEPAAKTEATPIPVTEVSVAPQASEVPPQIVPTTEPQKNALEMPTEQTGK